MVGEMEDGTRKGTAREDEGTYWKNGLRIEDARGEAEREVAYIAEGRGK